MSSSSARASEHRFYWWAAVASTLIVFPGFSRTFYLGALFDAPPLAWLLQLHGAIMTAWLALFLVQLRLVAAGRTDLHRKLGVAGGTLVALMVPVSVATAIDAGRRGVTPDPAVTPLMFMAIPIVTIAVFATLVGVALWNRRRSAVHKRLMLLATVSILTPAIARIPVIEDGGLPVFVGLTVLAVLLCIGVDTWRNRRLHPALGWGGAFVIVSEPFRLWLAGTDAWARFGTWLMS
ncbi:MAG: hypothetical protein EXQ49_07780 [Acidobacteria bacterium]|nr:hypothetical protein [Acidobacteriota bacterium]